MQPTVYFVDDDAAVRDAISLLLSLKGFLSQVFASAETFLETYRPEWRGVLLTDLRRRGQLDLARAVVDSASLRALRGGKKLDRTLPIAVRPGRNITFLPTPTGFRLSRASRRRTGTT